jgi:hypothetical protein
VGINTGSIIVSHNSDAKQAIGTQEFQFRVQSVRQMFHRGLGDPKIVIEEIDTLLNGGSNPELQFIKIVTLL